MSTSTNGELWYGVVFEEGYEFPWDAEPDDGDIQDFDDWWRAGQGFDATKGYPTEGWLDYQKQFDIEHPCPVVEVNYCSGEYPMYGLAVKGTLRTAYRGSPKLIEGLEVSESEIQLLRDFLTKYNLSPKSEEPEGWYLSSYWG
jgi:hypothetical protein